jgi:hypothetical protein
MHGFHIATNWKKSCWNSASMTLRQELTHWNASKKLTRAYAHHILAYARGPYCHPLTKDEQGGFGRGSWDFRDTTKKIPMRPWHSHTILINKSMICFLCNSGDVQTEVSSWHLSLLTFSTSDLGWRNWACPWRNGVSTWFREAAKSRVWCDRASCISFRVIGLAAALITPQHGS